ncbi:DUF2207 domain-containing protein [Neorhizobium sp. CSC1952]|uniref:DUF2207 domain-containing protein n=1 Tax=Neorhizobium sp. CSC1952 TaxID=2978974 RepID=UPI0025A67A72|nr:DUF2207 domain-containing protein [Rhizobium sp. CSC1952]WJR67938.1 DUF2207 domain-containing protein [Rhizobium sp. CSC1952]
MVRWFSGFWLALLFCLSVAPPVRAEEYIRAYHSDIEIARNGELTVSETITVNAEGRNIRRGIFRDFPLTMVDANGRTVRVGFDVVSVTRDGQREPWHTETVTGGIRIYAGSEDTLLRNGEHTYVFTYRTDRQIRYFDDHDELYWNVTGNGWLFRIAGASARITLPAGRITQTAAYTGPLGSTARNVRMQANGNEAVFATTRPLGEQEGLTIVVGFPKGIVAPPSADQERSWWFRDNLNLFLGFGGLILVIGYYFFFWTRVGRDPARGVMVPRWDAPDGISPALVNYIENKGFSGGGWTAFSASALDLAVKGYVKLEDLKEKIVIRRTDKAAPKNLPIGQASILGSVGGPGRSLVIDEAHGTTVQSVGASFRNAIEKEHRGRYYKANTGYVVGGVVLSVLAVLALIVFGNLEPDMIGMLIVPAFFAVFFGIFAVSLGKGLRRGSSLLSKIVSIVILGFIGLVALSIGSALLVAIMSEMTGSDHWPMLVAVGGIVLANVIFFFLMGAPTPLGRKLMDGIEGLRTYLTLAEKDRMNMAGAPAMSPQHFETLLPYAVALGVEKPWSRAFETWLATAAAGAAAASYAPGWYSGNYSNFGDRIGGFSSSMASTIASTIPAPKSSSSSSGFSGGSSGGGGGGGGGGGW